MKTNRRRFLLASAATVAAAAVPGPRARAKDQGDLVSVGLIGCGNQGGGLAKKFKATPQIRWAYVCDIDAARREETKALTGAEYAVADLRRVLDDKSVDAVIIATPDHWHVPAAILAMEAGKHVYLEKPCCQNFHEGLQLCEATRRTKRVLQHGTQFRSEPLALTVIEAIRAGMIGDVLVSKAWNIQRRNSIGHEQATAVPAGVDYDLWVGPAEFVPYQANRFHYNWRWWFNFGSGDMGNDGIHELDLARWGLGVNTLPTTVSGVGGKYFFDDDQEFPDTMSVAFEYPGDGRPGNRRTLLYEQRLWSTNYPFNVDSGVEFYGTRGKIFVSKRGKLEVHGERNVRLELAVKAAEGQTSHYENFCDCVRSGEEPRAGIDNAFRTAALSHLGNIAVRLGRSVHVDPQRQSISNDPDAEKLLTRNYRQGHWAIPKGMV